MSPAHFLGVLLILAIVAFQVRTTMKVWRSRAFDRPQKVAQSRLIWLLPLVGAAIVGAVLDDEDKRDGGNTPGLGS
jgi:hypothetical protein